MNLKVGASQKISTTNAYGKFTYDLLERAIIEIKHDEDEKKKNADFKEHYLLKAERYTGLHRSVVKKLCTDSINITTVTDIDRKYILDELMNYYLKLKTIPTSTQLFNSLQNHLSPYIDIGTFRNLLVKMGFIFKKSGSIISAFNKHERETSKESNIATVIENPAIRFERYMYLKKIKKYRDENKPIYFICEGAIDGGKIVNIDEQKESLFYIASSTKICFTLSKLRKPFQELIQDSLVELDVGGVIVLDKQRNNEKFCETPNVNSLKCDMIEWLEYYQIPHVKTMTKFELWMLIEKYTNTNVNLSKIDNLIIKHGFEVLRIPDCINNLTPASYIPDFIELTNVPENSFEDNFANAMLAVAEKHLPAINSSIAEEETRLLELEIKVDNIMDTLSPSTTPEIDEYMPCLPEF